MDLPTTLTEAFQRTVAAHPDRVAVTVAGTDQSLTWGEFGARVRAVAGGLHARGLRHGERIALVLPNDPRFHVVDTAAFHLGAVPFSIYATSSPQQMRFQIEDAGARIVVCAPEQEEALRAAGADPMVVGHLDDLPADDALTDLEFEEAHRSVKPSDLLTLIYTSGTTGPPKGVMITHANSLACAEVMEDVVGFGDHPRVLSYLPMAHVAERNNSHWFAMRFAMTVTSVPNPADALATLPQVRPTWFFGVPRVFEKLRAQLEAEGYESAEEAVARVGFDAAAAVNVGGAPAPKHLLEFWHGLGVPLAELWGMSELCGVGTINRVGSVKIGTVGPAVPGTDMRIADDGELLVRSPGLTPGYLNRQDLTDDAIRDGWLHTGDIGSIDDEGFLTLLDRKKELIISAGGKNMSPTNIESELTGATPLIGQAMAIGNDRPYNTALLVVDPEAGAAYAREHSIDRGELLTHQPFLDEIDAAVKRANAALSNVEAVKRYRVLDDEWLPDSAELTPTMKLRRKGIETRYADEIAALYV